eukprot:scaffold85846_cov40-Cyclotella_meneghiniana.AAC.2
MNGGSIPSVKHSTGVDVTSGVSEWVYGIRSEAGTTTSDYRLVYGRGMEEEMLSSSMELSPQRKGE